jgi:hypothetical protein
MRFSAVFVVPLLWALAATAYAGEVSIDRGLYVSIIGSCHDCHTEGYRESEGKINPETAMMGIDVGWQGPWGTSYSSNLRLIASSLSEAGFLRLLTSYKAKPPMPWYNLRKMEEADLKSLYVYLRSLGEPGKIEPPFVPPGSPVRTPFIVLDPPQLPPACTRDLDCGVGEICNTDDPRHCVKR